MKKFILCLLAVLSFNIFAANLDSKKDSSAIPMYYVSNIPNDEFLEKLQDIKFLSNLQTKLYGSPIYFRTTIQDHSTAGGSTGEFFTAMLAGGSLGIIPMVTNKDFVLRYEIFVNGEKLFDHQYTHNVTNAKFLFSGPDGNKLNPELLKWINGTIDEVTQMIQKDQKVKKLVTEYQYYFAQ